VNFGATESTSLTSLARKAQPRRQSFVLKTQQVDLSPTTIGGRGALPRQPRRFEDTPEAAARHGASLEEIAEALAVATAVNAGAALVYSTRVLDAYER
jgi:hypothetical protein